MLNLLRKDILLQKHNLWFAFAYSIFIFFAFSNNTFTPFVYIMGTVALSYVMVMAVIQSEYKNNSDIVLLSLPVKRQEVVAAKYLAVLVFIFLSLTIMGIIGFIFMRIPLPFPTRLINWQDAAITIISVIIFASVYIPAFYKVGGKWLQVINVVFFMLVFFAPTTLAGYMRTHRQNEGVKWLLVQMAGHNPHLSSCLGIIFVGVLMLISYLISLHIYKNQDF